MLASRAHDNGGFHSNKQFPIIIQSGGYETHNKNKSIRWCIPRISHQSHKGIPNNKKLLLGMVMIGRFGSPYPAQTKNIIGLGAHARAVKQQRGQRATCWWFHWHLGGLWRFGVFFNRQHSPFSEKPVCQLWGHFSNLNWRYLPFIRPKKGLPLIYIYIDIDIGSWRLLSFCFILAVFLMNSWYFMVFRPIIVSFMVLGLRGLETYVRKDPERHRLRHSFSYSTYM